MVSHGAGPQSVEYYMGKEYPITLTRRVDDDEPYWVAEIPELPGCVSDGKTPDEAVESLRDAKSLWIETQLSDDYEVPEPVDVQGHSGKLSLRIPKSLHRRIAEIAHREGVSLNQYIMSCVATGLGWDQQARELRALSSSMSESNDQLKTLIEVYHTPTNRADSGYL